MHVEPLRVITFNPRRRRPRRVADSDLVGLVRELERRDPDVADVVEGIVRRLLEDAPPDRHAG